MSYFSKKNVVTALSVIISFIFIQSLFFKFMNAPETVHIFSTIADWMSGTIFGFASEAFRSVGGYATGVVELIASGFLLSNVYNRLRSQDVTSTQARTFYGAAIAFVVMTGAIFFHLFTPLGINVQGDGGALFTMAVIVWFASVYLMCTHKHAVCAPKAMPTE